jgi:hypothetical protein
MKTPLTFLENAIGRNKISFICIIIIVICSCTHGKNEKDSLLIDRGLSIPFFTNISLDFMWIEDWKGDVVLFQRAGAGMDSFTLATYNIKTNEYREFPFYFPMGYGSPSFLHENEVIIFPTKEDISKIYSFDISSRSVRFITDGSAPAPSPINNTIAYFANDNLYLLDLDSGENKSLMPVNFYFTPPRWSPSGKYIALTEGIGDKEQGVIYIINVEKPEIKSLQVDGEAGDIIWSPDSETLAYTEINPGSACIKFYDIKSACVVGKVCSEELVFHPFWSPDGKYIVYRYDNWYGLDIQKLREGGYLSETCDQGENEK